MRSKLTLAVGVFLVLLALATAMGSVSVGQYAFLSSSGSGQVVGLLSSPMFEALSVVFAGLGMVFIYFAGRNETRPLPK